MSSDTTALGDRMKGYEAATRFELPRRTYTIARVDGRAFHSYLRQAEKPFDFTFMEVMDEVAAALCAEMMGAVFSYAHSDEISVLLADFGAVHTEAWFGGTVQKMASIAAAMATAEFAFRVIASNVLRAELELFFGALNGDVTPNGSPVSASTSSGTSTETATAPPAPSEPEP